jgi:hypothetical protein
MTEIVGVETIRVPNKHERKLMFLADSSRAANEIARKRNATAAANRKKYATRKKP